MFTLIVYSKAIINVYNGQSSDGLKNELVGWSKTPEALSATGENENELVEMSSR